MDELQTRLTRLAEHTAPPPRERLAEVVVARHRAHRRQTMGLTALVAAVAAVVVAVPALLDAAPPAEPAIGVAAPAAADGDVLSGPTRGSLAGDAAFVDAVRQLSWTEAADPDAPTAAADPALDTRQVVFAGDVAGGRWALVVAQDTIGSEPPAEGSGLAAAWFTGPAGATPAHLQPAALLGGVDPTRPLALSDAATGALVVVAAPGDEVRVSARPEVAADGTVDRTYEQVDVADGIAVVTLSPSAGSYDEAVRFRVTRGGDVVVTEMPQGWRSDWSALPAVTWLGQPDSTADAQLTEGARHTLTITGLTPGQIGFGVVWAGDLPAAGGQSARLQLMSATLPSGASYLEALLGSATAGGPAVGTWCGTDLRPADPPLAEQVFAVQCAGAGPSGSASSLSTLVLVAPSRATSVWLTDDAGARLEEHPLVDGSAVVSAPRTVSGAEFLAADGSLVGRTGTMGMAGVEGLTATSSSGD
jgi:hypothetical protein